VSDLHANSHFVEDHSWGEISNWKDYGIYTYNFKAHLLMVTVEIDAKI
jgi:hypothetical protein